MNTPKQTSVNNQIGFHYFQDTLHYSNQDLSIWLPELQKLKAGWVVLLSEFERAIPEQFITGLIDAGINPIIHFKLPLPDAPTAAELKPILSAYRRWGAQYVVFFDKPNEAGSWSPAGWSHQDLVERFIDRFAPLAQEAARIGLTPVFPPLMPGGNYWDLSFFKSAIQSLQRRGQHLLLDRMAAAVYAYTFGHELSWGEGGPETWRQVKPYFTPADSQDQRGFNNHKWIYSIARSLGIKNLPMLQFGAGIKQPGSYYSPEVHAEIVQTILNQLDTSDSESILACNFWLLAAESDSDQYAQAWIKSDHDTLPVVRALFSDTVARKTTSPITERYENPFAEDVDDFDEDPFKGLIRGGSHPINHYLLLPVYEWGIADWHLDVIRPFVMKHQPTVGFSLTEAAQAAKVTIIDGENFFSDDEIRGLRENGCLVDLINGDGTSIATQLLER